MIWVLGVVALVWWHMRRQDRVDALPECEEVSARLPRLHVTAGGNGR